MPLGHRPFGEAPVDLTCPVCGRRFRRFASQVKARGARYCSRDCKAIGEKRRSPQPCKQCGELFEPQPRDRRDPNRGKFCTRDCYVEWRQAQDAERSELTCSSCGRLFHRPNAWVRKGKPGAPVYCSRRCTDDGRYRGAALPRRGRRWRELAESIRERDDYRCVRCGEPETNGRSLSVDHILPARMFLMAPELADDPRNLASLCAACHAVKTHRYEPRILRGDFLAIDEFYGTETRCVVVALIPTDPDEAKRLGLLRPGLPEPEGEHDGNER